MTDQKTTMPQKRPRVNPPAMTPSNPLVRLAWFAGAYAAAVVCTFFIRMVIYRASHELANLELATLMICLISELATLMIYLIFFPMGLAVVPFLGSFNWNAGGEGAIILLLFVPAGWLIYLGFLLPAILIKSNRAFLILFAIFVVLLLVNIGGCVAVPITGW